MGTETQYLIQKAQSFLELGKNKVAQYFIQETSNQKRLCKELDDALKKVNDTTGGYGDIETLRNFLEENKNDNDLKFVLNLRREKSESTVLHDVAVDTYAYAEEVAYLLVNAGADTSIRNRKGKTPLHIAVNNGCYSVEQFLLTDKHRKLKKELCDILSNIHKEMPDYWADDYHEKYGHLKFEAKPEGIVELKEFLAKYEDDEDLKTVLNLQNTLFGTVLHNPEYFSIKEVVELLLKAGADPNIKNENEKSILECVIDAACCTTEDAKNKEKYRKIIKSLINAKADVNSKDYAGQTLLHRLAMDLRESAAEFLLTSIEDKTTKAKLINAQDKGGNTALHDAANYSGGRHIVELFLKHGARWDIKNKKQDTALHLSCFRRDDKAIEAFLKIGGLNINIKDAKGATPLLIAAAHGSVNTVKLFLDKEANVHEKDNDDNSVLHYAVRSEYDDSNEIGAKHRDASEAYYANTTRDNCSIISSLMHKGASINAKNKYGHTPLFSAVEAVESFPIDSKGNKYEVIELFLESGADISIADEENSFTVFHFAIKQRSLDLLNVLLPKKTTGDIDVEKAKELLGVIDKEGNTLLHHAVKWGCKASEGILDFLVENGVDINAKNKHGVAPIHIAAKYGNPSQMEFFIKKKADLNARCGKFSKPGIDNIGKEKGFSSNNDYINIQDGSVDVSNTVDIKDDTEHKNAPPISIATESSHKSIVNTLIYEGAKPSIEDSRGWLPLHIAIKRALDKNCAEEEREERYEIIKKLASVSAVTKGTLNAFRNFVSHDEHDKEEIEKILQDAIERENGVPTAPVDEEASAPSFDDNFYDEINVKKPTLYPDLSEELASNKDSWSNWQIDHIESGIQQQPSTQWEGDGWEDDNWETGVHKDLGTSYWDSAPVAKSLTKKPEDQKSISTVTDKQKDQKQGSFKLTPHQRIELNKFLDMVSKAQNMDSLDKVVSEALNSGVRLNAHKDEGYSFTDSVISQINKLKQNPRAASNIVCKLTAKGAVFSQKINNEIEALFEDHKINIQSANAEFCKRLNKLQEYATDATTSGKLIKVDIDNDTFHLEYSSDSVVDIAKVIDGAKSLGLNQGDISFSVSIVKIGESEVEIEVKNGTRNYTDLSNDGDVILTFHTSLGELEVRLYHNMQNKGRITVEVNDNDKEKINKLKNNEEIGENCQLGGYSVYDAIEQGYFERSVNLQSSEVINLPEKIMEEASEIIKSLKHSDTKANSWTDKVQHSKVNREGIQI